MSAQLDIYDCIRIVECDPSHSLEVAILAATADPVSLCINGAHRCPSWADCEIVGFCLDEDPPLR